MTIALADSRGPREKWRVRIVSLACSNTEIVCALGLAECLVGVDDHSDYPEEVVTRLPRVGPDLGIDVEKVRALEPDLVLASLTVPGHERIVEAVARAGLEYLAPEPTCLEHVFRDVTAIAMRLGAPERGAALVASMRAQLPETPRRAPAPRILVEWWPKPVIVPGRLSWVSDLLELVGAENPFADRRAKSLPVGDEEVQRLAPDAVVISWCGVPSEKYRRDVVRRRSGWAATPALEHDRVFAVPEAWLGRPGPRLVQGYRALSAVADACR